MSLSCQFDGIISHMFIIVILYIECVFFPSSSEVESGNIIHCWVLWMGKMNPFQSVLALSAACSSSSSILSASSFPSSPRIQICDNIIHCHWYWYWMGKMSLSSQFDGVISPCMFIVSHHHLEYRYVITIYIVSGTGWRRWVFPSQIDGIISGVFHHRPEYSRPLLSDHHLKWRQW